MPVTIQTFLKEYVDILKNIFGDHMEAVILYGSYARGDFRADSDLDICIILDEDELGMKKYMSRLAADTFDFNMEKDVEINPIMVSERTFLKWRKVYPFYQNIDREGVKLYAA